MRQISHSTVTRAAGGGAAVTDGSDDEEQANFLPKEFVCPITQELLEDPVIAEDGFSYERIAMERWFSTGKTRSPVTSERMEGRTLTENKVMKAMIQNYRRELGTRLLQSCNALSSESKSGEGGERGRLHQQQQQQQQQNSLQRGGGLEASPSQLLPPEEPLTSKILAAFHEGGADLNVRDGDGNTPLLLLLQAGQLSLAEELLRLPGGARASQRNDLGTAPLDLCRSLRDTPAVDGPAALVSVMQWDRMLALLERRTTAEALADEERDKIRQSHQLRQRQRQADMEQVGGWMGGRVGKSISLTCATRDFVRLEREVIGCLKHFLPSFLPSFLPLFLFIF